MRIWYDVEDEGVHLSVKRLIAPDAWLPTGVSATYPTWAAARRTAIARQRWVMSNRQYDPACEADPMIEALWPDRNAAAVSQTREFAQAILDDLENAPEDAHGFDVFETLRRSRFKTDTNDVPRTEVLAGAAVTHDDVDREVFNSHKRDGVKGEADFLPRMAEPFDVGEAVAVRDAISEGLDGYRSRCLASGSEVSVVVEEAFARRLMNRIELHLCELQEQHATFRFTGTMSPPPFRTPEGAVAWVKRLADLLMLDE